MTMTFELPLRLESLSNVREHWAVRHKRAKAHRKAAYLTCKAHPVPCVVTITRIAPRALDDDNLRHAVKAVRDGIADRLGVDDRDPRVKWRYVQTRSARPKHYSCLVQIDAEEETR
jgi:hypothetical protein